MTPAAREPGASFPDAPFIAADVGGTHARLALARIANGAPVVLHHVQYRCADHADLAAILRDFLAAHPRARETRRAALAIAGVVEGDQLISPNLPWRVSLTRTRQQAELEDLAVVNDFEALAHAVPHVDLDGALALTGKPVAPGETTTLVLGPGTGFGAALRVPTQPFGTVIATEAGHASLAAGNELELAVLRLLLRRWSHVDRERILSGPGLLNAYACLCELHGAPRALETPADIANAALAGIDAQAVAALELFCAMLGSLAGDLVLGCNARAVLLAGGIPWRIREFLARSHFVARFLDKGALRPVLAQVPVWLIDHGQLGLLGAAAWYRDRCARESLR